jgi:hypothetical protein
MVKAALRPWWDIQQQQHCAIFNQIPLFKLLMHCGGSASRTHSPEPAGHKEQQQPTCK